MDPEGPPLFWSPSHRRSRACRSQSNTLRSGSSRNNPTSDTRIRNSSFARLATSPRDSEACESLGRPASVRDRRRVALRSFHCAVTLGGESMIGSRGPRRGHPARRRPCSRSRPRPASSSSSPATSPRPRGDAASRGTASRAGPHASRPRRETIERDDNEEDYGSRKVAYQSDVVGNFDWKEQERRKQFPRVRAEEVPLLDDAHRRHQMHRRERQRQQEQQQTAPPSLNGWRVFEGNGIRRIVSHVDGCASAATPHSGHRSGVARRS